MPEPVELPTRCAGCRMAVTIEYEPTEGPSRQQAWICDACRSLNTATIAGTVLKVRPRQ